MTPLDIHGRGALHFSGGKDSLALVYLLRPEWDHLTLYHVDTGDLLPEVRQIVDMVEAMVPKFVRIDTKVDEWIKAAGMPSDLVPTSNTLLGRLIEPSKPRLVDRMECCATNLMAPMHYRMLEDKVPLVIRGTKKCDLKKLPHEGGDTDAGYELWLPLIDWSHDDVFAYLREVGAPICRVYEHKVNAPECATCSAWWSEGRAEYLKKYHPDLFKTYRVKLAAVAAEITPHWASLQEEFT